MNIKATTPSVSIILDGKTLETALIDMSLATGPAVGMQPHRVRERNPPQKATHAFL